MAFVAGNLAKVMANGFDLSAYFNNLATAQPVKLLETTAFGKTFVTRIAGLKDGSIAVDGLWDGSVDAVDEDLREILGTNDSIWTAFFDGDTAGKRGRGCQAVESSYAVKEAVEGVVEVSAEASSDDGLDFLVSLHALGAEVATGTGTVHDNLAASTNGGAAYLQVTAVTAGDTLDVIVQGSTTGAWGGEETTIGTFTQVTDTGANTAQRITFTGTVPRYIRGKWTIGGAGPSFTFQVSYARR